jgi:hypothetical protein
VIAKGEPWGDPAAGPPELAVDGGDDALALAVAAHHGARIGFDPAPGSDFARAVGLTSGSALDTDLLCDALDVVLDESHGDTVALVAVNMVVVGTAPDRQHWWSRASGVQVTVDDRVVHEGAATGVVIANGQFLHGNDVAPRGHPGDGRIELQVYSVPRRERRALRRRVRDGTHLPHPRVRTATGRRVEVQGAPRAVEVDGVRAGRARTVAVAVAPAAFTLLV